MDHSALEAQIPAYAIGALDVEERRTVEAHLFLCPPCRRLLCEYRELSNALLFAIPVRSAPPHLEWRLRQNIQPSWSGPRSWLLATAAVFVLMAASIFYETRILQQHEHMLHTQATALTMLAEGRSVSLHGDALAPQARGELYLSPGNQRALLHVSHLPPVPEGKAYQIWLINDGQRDSGGVFRVGQTGEAVLLITAPRPWRHYQAIGITVEPATGSRAPTSPRVLGGRLE